MKTFITVLAAVAAMAVLTSGRPVVVGHRGSDVGVESSVEALATGAKRGYAIIESDIKVTADGQYVLCHDDSTGRLGGRHAVATSTLAELQSDTLSQTRWGHPYTGRLASLKEMLDICRSHGVRPLIELKWATGINSNDTSGIPAFVDFLDAEGVRSQCILLTSMKPCLEFIHANYPDIEFQLLTQTRTTENLQWCIDNGATAIDIRHDAINSEVVDTFHNAGIKVGAWTVNDPARFDYLESIGCDYITTDSLPPLK